MAAIPRLLGEHVRVQLFATAQLGHPAAAVDPDGATERVDGPKAIAPRPTLTLYTNAL